MAARSQNGYTANDRSVLTTYMVGTTKFLLRKGSPGWLLWHFLSWFDANIRDINPGILDDWSYAERPIRGGEETSNHASGTAADVDATKWPLGVDPSAYLTAAEIRRVREHLKVYRGAIRWGGDYTGRKDPMHFEINKDEAFCDAVMRDLEDTMPTPAEIAKAFLAERIPDPDKAIREKNPDATMTVAEALTAAATNANHARYDNTPAAMVDELLRRQVSDPDKAIREKNQKATSSVETMLVAAARGSAAAAAGIDAVRPQLQAALVNRDPVEMAAAIREEFDDDLVADVAARLRVSPV